MTFDKIIIESKYLINVYKNKTTLLLLTIIPFMLLFIMTYIQVFIDFALILFLLVIYYLKQIVSLTNEINLVEEISLKAKKVKIKKTYKRGSHLIQNPSQAILSLGGYTYVGKDERGIKIFQNITEVTVFGEINTNSGEVVYDKYGVPSNLIK